jgi:thioredoxin 1
MAEIITLTDAELEPVLQGDKPVLLLLTTGDDLRGDFATAFRNASKENDRLVFARINPQENPQAAARFDVGSKSVLIGWVNGEALVRRGRPWGSDVPLAIEMLQNAAPVNAPQSSTETENTTNQALKEQTLVDNKPVDVTDNDFQQEVIDHDLPVVVDFWAPWCGPCRMVAPILDKLAAEFAGKVRIAKVNVDENPQLSQAFQIMSIPTLMMFKERNVVFNQPGALPEPALRDLFEQLVALEIPAQEEGEQEEIVD